MLSINFIKKTDIVLLDDNYANLKFQNFKQETVNFKKINIFGLLITFKNYFFKNKHKLKLSKLYKQTVLRMYKPSIVITHNLGVFSKECKILCPEIKVIVYQFSYFYSKNNYTKDKTFNCDLFFANHEKDKNILIKRKIPKKKIIISGSIKNNERKLLSNKKKRYDILYISQYIEKNQNHIYGYDQHYKGEKFIIKLLSEYCQRNNLQLNVALKFARKDKIKYSSNKLKNEINFFKSFVKSKINFLTDDSLGLAYQSNLIVTQSSNFGMELISRKKKVLFLPFDDQPGKIINYYLPRNNQINVHRKKDKKEIFKKLNFLIKLDKKTWRRYLSTSEYFNFKYDYKNKILKKIVSKLIKKNEN